MKKTYIAPFMNVIIVNTHQMVCTSPNTIPQVGGTTSDTGDLLSRRRGGTFFDDDEE